MATMITPLQAEGIASSVIDGVAFESPLIFGEVIGLLAGDGHVGEESVIFFNSEPQLIIRYLKNMRKLFRLKQEEFHYYVYAPPSSSKKGTSLFWKRLLKTKKKIITATNPRARKERGMMRVALSRKAIAEFLKRFCAVSKLRRINNQEFRRGFLRGFMAAEGSVIPGKVHKEVPNAIQLSQKGRETPLLLKDYLADFGIQSRVIIKQKDIGYYCVTITDRENYGKFFKAGLANLHPDKRRKLEVGLKSYKWYIRPKNSAVRDILAALEKKPRTRQYLYKKLGLSPQHINSLLYTYKKSVLLKQRLTSKRKSGQKICWKITEAGRKFLKAMTRRSSF